MENIKSVNDIRLDKKLQNVSLCISTKLEERHHPGSINTESQDRFQELLEVKVSKYYSL